MFGSLLFASGAAALIFQVLWIKQLSLVVGIDVYAVTTAVSAFFAGLAFGSAWFGRKGDWTARPVLLYGLLELGIGLVGVATTLALAHSGTLFVLLSERAGIVAWALPFTLIGIPAVLMGGTLPVLVRAQAPQTGDVPRAGGELYAANTAGAIAGALLASFTLIPAFGVRGASFAAAGINVTLATVAAVLDYRIRSQSVASRPATANRMESQARIALLLYATAGGIALGYEVVWSQVVVQFTSTRTFSFAVVLATYLAGLTIGSALYARWNHRVRDGWGVFGFLIAAAGLVALIEIAALGDWLIRMQSQAEQMVQAMAGTEMLAMCARFLVAALSIVFLPTVLLGAAFPAALRLIAGSHRVGRDLGAVVALNTAGGVAGTVLTGFLLVPRLGLVHTLGVLAIGAASLGFFAALRSPAIEHRTAWLLLSMTAGAVLVAALTPEDRVIRLLPEARGGSLVFFEEDPGGTIAVIEQRAKNASFRRLYIDGVSNSGDPMPSLRYMRMQALLPLIVHRGEPHSALVIGFGTGITTGALLQFPNLEQRVCAELLKGVIHAAPIFQGNFRAASDSRIEIRLHDGRQELLRSPESYDLITLEPPPPSAAGVVNLYSSDFYRLARSRLKRNGIFAQWWPLATQNDEDSRSLVRSFLDVFPHVSLWTTEIHEMLLVGSPQPLDLDLARIAARFNQPGVAATLREVGIDSAAALLATWITSRQGLERYAENAPPVTDDRPRVEYATWLRRGEFARVLPKVLALQTDPPVQGADAPFRHAIAKERRSLLDFYAAALYAYQGDRTRWAQAMERVPEEDADNPYFRWIAGLPQK